MRALLPHSENEIAMLSSLIKTELAALIASDIVIDDPELLSIELPHDASMAELGCKAAASILLSKAGPRRIVVPSSHEWFGVGLLERDGELKRG